MSQVIRAALVTGLVAIFAVPVAADTLDDGMAAAKRGDYATAMRLWRPLAEQGNGGKE